METQWERRQWDHQETEIPVDHQLDDREVEWMMRADVHSETREQDFVQLAIASSLVALTVNRQYFLSEAVVKVNI